MANRHAASRWDYRNLTEVVRRRSLWMEFLGVALLALGLLALVAVIAASVATVFLFGGLLLASGVLTIAATAAFWRTRSGGYAMGMILGVLGVLAGILCFIRPGLSLGALTLALGAYFIASGIARLSAAMRHRLPGWGWGVGVGSVDLILGVLILASWPVSSLVVPGTLLGIQLIAAGIAAIVTGSAVRRFLAPGSGAEPGAPGAGRPETRFQH
jgi:uncharacterized membrane protein HdeD (DUF308 family)